MKNIVYAWHTGGLDKIAHTPRIIFRLRRMTYEQMVRHDKARFGLRRDGR